VSDFKIEGPLQAVAQAADSSKGVEVTVNIKYEPITIGDSRSILKLNSPEGMEYTCLLFGKSTAPVP
jgi:hydrocephalus-inducing protein